MANIKIVVDVRETRLYEYMLNMLPDDNVVCQALDIGDVEVSCENPKFHFIFERKTEKDLAASIKDGRYREQKLRMLHTTYKHHCTYIIENPYHWESHACPSSQYIGAIMNTMYRDGMHVVVVPSTQATAEWIVRLIEKCKEHPDKFVEASSADCDYLAMRRVKTKRQDNIDVATCYQLQLCQIPGISQKIASAIAEKFPSWKAMYGALNGCDTEEAKVKLICQVPMIGGKKAKAFLEFIQETAATV